MKLKSKLTTYTVLLLAFSVIYFCCNMHATGQSIKISLLQDEVNNKIEILADGKPFTTYQWPDNICKPVLYPIYTSAGTEITRGYPVKPRTGEQVDHPHQIGMWLTYGNVNGLDFWGNGSQGLGTKNSNGGIIKHIGFDKVAEEKNEGIIITNESWIDNSGIELLKEKTEFRFSGIGSQLVIDRITTLTASNKDVQMPDTKEGMFAIRVARQLELPTQSKLTLWGSEGKPVKMDKVSNDGISGNYLSSEGVTGEAVWGTRARWMNLSGNIGNEKISLVIIDHPKNPGYPTHWHARGYGLFSINPFGVKDFTNGKETLNFSVPAGKSITFRYRFIIASGSQPSIAEMNKWADEFARIYR